MMTHDDAAHDENGMSPAAPKPLASPPNNEPNESPTFPVISPPRGLISTPAPTPPAVHAAIGFLFLFNQLAALENFETFLPAAPPAFAVLLAQPDAMGTFFYLGKVLFSTRNAGEGIISSV